MAAGSMGEPARHLRPPPSAAERLVQLVDEDLVAALRPEEIPAALGHLGGLMAQLTARLLRDGVAERALDDEMLDARAAAKMLNVSIDYLYEHSGQFKFTRHAGRKVLFSRNGIQDYIRKGR